MTGARTSAGIKKRSTTTSKKPSSGLRVPVVPDPIDQENATARQQLYFAFGSNLSHSQMHQRCKFAPEISARPLAIAALDGWRWIINERGYASVVPVRGFQDYFDGDGGGGAGGGPTAAYDEGDEEQQQQQQQQQRVYGIIYSMVSQDERRLDRHEGVDRSARALAPTHPPLGHARPREQGQGHYNKWYLPVTVTKWLDEEFRASVATESIEDGAERLTALVYIDEYNAVEGKPKLEYIARMNRGIREAVALGLPSAWVEAVMRRFIPAE
ncbi:hypothetical protein LOZ12_004089 [Ophidiomyces ophidiicola]|uniref:Uncharacterized protein n=1 Tax=Ophidiomyces ophidiicola TaxID=1387563 RepID=A0ACB8V1C7_9EURO|nr:hypothetical protein LOZ62_001014 [Ophidiomyces ophidiicola]KAI1970539.1 hypothetical protein LOZ56_003615 [Ophidiomyces ophidiicola]KAI2009753.1 hypothetical protein LOZ50_001487 [Ophidiomyces ophidiicola]KAI2026253.1 hypothetical protein LOZ48_005120 [Ophidiomyces ophidiicola]KAI2037993.1 hypothetical protein LOZ47_003466 [Ophidiomyces ophidiicola]